MHRLARVKEDRWNSCDEARARVQVQRPIGRTDLSVADHRRSRVTRPSSPSAVAVAAAQLAVRCPRLVPAQSHADDCGLLGRRATPARTAARLRAGDASPNIGSADVRCQTRRQRIRVAVVDLEQRYRTHRGCAAHARYRSRCRNDRLRECVASHAARASLLVGGEALERDKQADDLLLAHLAGTADAVMRQARQLAQRRELRRRLPKVRETHRGPASAAAPKRPGRHDRTGCPTPAARQSPCRR